MNLKIFYSHAWNDKAGAKVKKLLIFLQKDYDVWLDKVQIKPGDHINDTVAEGIAGCDIFINVWSRNAHSSEGVMFEIDTAVKLKKTILVLIIDDYSTNNCPHLAGREYFDFSGDEKNFIEQQIYLQNFLLQKKLEVYKKHFTKAEDQQVVKELENKVSSVQEVLMQLEDTFKRQKMNASGNDDSDVYISSSLNAFEGTLNTENEEGKQLLHFSAAMKEISEKYPLREDDKLKKRLAIKAIEQIDPLAVNEQLAALKLAFENDLGQKKTEVTPVASTQQVVSYVPLQQSDKLLMEAYRDCVNKTRHIAINKAKSSFGGISFLNILTSINVASTEFEMQYITSSPALLEKMFDVASHSENKELQSIIAILIKHIKVDDLKKAAATEKINAYMPYAYLINNTARLLIQAKALNENEVSHNLLSSLGVDKLSKFFFKEDWKEKAEQFLDMVKNNYGIEDKNLNWIKAAAAVVGVILVADALSDGIDADAGSADGLASSASTGGSLVYFEDKMAAMGLHMPNTVQY